MAAFDDHEAVFTLKALINAKFFVYSNKERCYGFLFSSRRLRRIILTLGSLSEIVSEGVEDDHVIVGAFDYTEEMESPFQNLDADTEELDIPHFVGDLRALMVDDSEDEVVLDSDDEAIPEQKEGKMKGKAENWLNRDSLAEPKKKVNEKPLKVYRRKKQKQDSHKENVKPDKEVKTFSPVASRTRCGSSVKHSKRTEDATCNPDFIIHGKQIAALHKRKMGDLKFDTWKCPKKKRTCRNTRQNANIISTFYVLSSVVKSEGNFREAFLMSSVNESEGKFREAFFMSSVKRKARSASKYMSTSGNKLLKSGQPSLVDVTNTKCVSMIPETFNGCGEEKIKDLLFNENNNKPSILSRTSNESSLSVYSVGLPRKQLHKKSSTSPSLRNELTRLGYSESTPDFTSKELRRRRNKVEIRVLFSQSLDDDVVKQQRKILKKLGTCMATDCTDATHFVADGFARTKKMLEIMGLGKQVVTPLWLESCEQAGCVIDEKNYILRDAKKEKDIGFSMPVSLSRATTHPLLKDQRVFITPNVKPDRETVKSLIKAVHGQVMEGIQEASMEYKTSDDLLILSSEQDYVLCVPFLDKGAAVYSSELLLNGIIIQKLEYAKHQLFTGHVIMKRYTRKRKKNGSQHLDVAYGC
ncbi:hypothetical protein L2E82_19914 [Cichorium intybus]|uniref:Uncharacterized protein n=1 Tax=Cichorium intybus TaxID=13427 RepID=A0ACB9DSP2_CICIN|nr:hypothetical protein L2E82_19914 [Cichorium intybus]